MSAPFRVGGICEKHGAMIPCQDCVDRVPALDINRVIAERLASTPAVPDSSATGSDALLEAAEAAAITLEEVFEAGNDGHMPAATLGDAKKAAEALREALEASTPPAASGSAEPVAIFEGTLNGPGGTREFWGTFPEGSRHVFTRGDALYAGAPPSQPSKDLTTAYMTGDAQGVEDGIKRASVSAKDAEPEADMFWNDDDAERNHGSISEFLNEEICQNALEVGAEFTLRCAYSLPNLKIRVTSIDEDQCEAEYEVITPAASKGAV